MPEFGDNGRLIILLVLAGIALLPWLMSRMRDSPNLRWIDVQDLANQIKDKNKIIVVDVRTRGELNGSLGQIKRATNIPLHELSRRMQELSAYKDKPVVVVCRTDRRAVRAAIMLMRAGWNDVSVLRGGMMQWSRLPR